DYLSDIVFGEHNDLYPEIPASYAEALGDDGLTIFNNGLQARWDTLPPLRQGASFDEKWPYLQLQRMMEDIAKLSDDSQAIIRLREKTATSLHDYQELAGRCLEMGDYVAVESWLEKCRHASEQDYRQNTARIQVSLCVARELWTEALEQQWSLYKKSHDFRDYLTLLELSAKARDNKNWREKVIHFLQKDAKPVTRWAGPVTDTLLEIYLYHEAYEDGYKLVAKENARHALLLELAWNISNQPDRAFPLFQRVIESLLSRTNNNAYGEAIQLMQDMANKLQSRQQQQCHTELLALLREKYRAKRNFIKWLNEAFE
ncbi:MAG: hypothetical protein LJE83_06145, partial [Gammaproteobacteria bacterium]|nr:hypothetical protein [Gammaproteobacteria bacterium]